MEYLKDNNNNCGEEFLQEEGIKKQSCTQRDVSIKLNKTPFFPALYYTMCTGYKTGPTTRVYLACFLLAFASRLFFPSTRLVDISPQ